MRLGYVWYIPVIQADVPACTTFIEMYVQRYVQAATMVVEVKGNIKFMYKTYQTD